MSSHFTVLTNLVCSSFVVYRWLYTPQQNNKSLSKNFRKVLWKCKRQTKFKRKCKSLSSYFERAKAVISRCDYCILYGFYCNLHPRLKAGSPYNPFHTTLHYMRMPKKNQCSCFCQVKPKVNTIHFMQPCVTCVHLKSKISPYHPFRATLRYMRTPKKQNQCNCLWQVTEENA